MHKYARVVKNYQKHEVWLLIQSMIGIRNRLNKTELGIPGPIPINVNFSAGYATGKFLPIRGAKNVPWPLYSPSSWSDFQRSVN